jgi:serine/threonine protein kinase
MGGRARLTDFGLATMLHATKTATGSPGMGSLRWMAPELMDPDEYGIAEDQAGRPTKLSDMYALAMTIWEVSFILQAFVCRSSRGRFTAASFPLRKLEATLKSSEMCSMACGHLVLMIAM